MAIKMEEVTLPLSEFYIGATTLVPTSAEVKAGTTIELDAKGVPTETDWFHVGATSGEGTWEFTRDTIELEIEQVLGIPEGGILYNKDGLTMKIPMFQFTYDRLSRALAADTYTATGGHIVTVGGETTPTMFSVLLVAEHRAGAGVFHQFCIYKAMSSEGVSLSFSKADGMKIEMTCRGLIDPDRDKGDQLGYAYIADIESV